MGQIINQEQRQIIFKLERETKYGLALCKRMLEKCNWDYKLSKEKIKSKK